MTPRGEVQVRKEPSFSGPAEGTLEAIRVAPSREWLPGDVVVLLNKGFRHFRPEQNRSPLAFQVTCGSVWPHYLYHSPRSLII